MMLTLLLVLTVCTLSPAPSPLPSFGSQITAMEVLSPSRQGQPGNAYLPHRVLLAQCQLFLGHYGCSSLHLSRGLKECRSTTQRSALLEVQLLYNLG